MYVSPLQLYSEPSGDHYGGNVLEFGSCYGLYISSIVFFYLPHVVDVSALSICIVLCASVLVFSMCLLYESLESRVSASIMGMMFMVSVVIYMCSAS